MGRRGPYLPGAAELAEAAAPIVPGQTARCSFHNNRIVTPDAIYRMPSGPSRDEWLPASHS